MNVLITGANGQLGKELSKILPDAILTGHEDLDITDFVAVRDFVAKNHIDTVVNCAAYTAVDAAEDDYFNAKQVNAIGPKNIAQMGCKIIQVSTDYVFDGCGKAPYKTDDEVAPLSVYGWTKLLGEQNVQKYSAQYAIIRTSWLYSPYGKNFIKTMRRLATEKDSINVVSDQTGSPTYAKDLAEAIVQIIPQMNFNNRGIYHYANKGETSWYDFAREVMHQSGLNCKVIPISTAEYSTKAVRPKYSVLDTGKIESVFGVKIPDWKDALGRCIDEINEMERG